VPVSRRRGGAPRPRKRRIRKLRLAALAAVLALLASASFTFGLISAVASELPTLDPARALDEEVNGYVYAANGETVLAVLRGSESRVLVDSEDIAPVMKQAIVAIEDRRFWEHDGVDVRAVLRALWTDVRQQGVVQGGSTITQQFVKNQYVRNTRTIGRKVREAALAWQLERSTNWPKERILTAYLNTIYFGNGAYGVQQAARIYFDKGPGRLTLPEAALLAGIPADPSGYDPVAHPVAARERRDTVLRAMLETGVITRSELEEARQAAVPREVRIPGTEGPAPFFTNYVKDQLVDAFGGRRVFGDGLRVTTTLDLDLQDMARDAIAGWLAEENGPRAALVALEPSTGNVVAMVGGNYRESQFNLAVQGQRQPGSAFKPLVLAAALERGVAPSTTLDSRPLQIPFDGKVYPVSNYEDAYLGEADLETATVHSDNAVYVQLTQLVGPPAVVRTAARLGVQSRLRPFLSIGLGAQAVNPLELARAYSAFANGGFRIDGQLRGPRVRKFDPAPPRVIDEVRNAGGSLAARNFGRPQRVLQPRTAAWITSFLQEAIEEGTGRRAALDSRWSVAGKTGTTEHYGDGWFVGYSPDLVAAVWVGYPEGLRPMLTEFNGEPVAGGTYPALIWKSFMARALPYLEKTKEARPEPFAEPPYEGSIAAAVVNRDGVVARDNGQCNGVFEIDFFPDRLPQRTARCRPNEVEVPTVMGTRLATARQRLAAQPLTPRVVWRTAEPGQKAGFVVWQRPRRGRLSSYDEVTLVVARAPKERRAALRRVVAAG
jgi:penicillin-binding protein 1A